MCVFVVVVVVAGFISFSHFSVSHFIYKYILPVNFMQQSARAFNRSLAQFNQGDETEQQQQQQKKRSKLFEMDGKNYKCLS